MKTTIPQESRPVALSRARPGGAGRGLTVVTGASGHVGGNLVRALLDRGRRVRAIVRPDDPAPALAGLDVERAAGDLAEPDSLAAAFDGADVVFHLAGLISIMPGHEGALEKINVEGASRVVDACLRTRVGRLVHFSSVHALAPSGANGLIDESRPLVTDPAAPPYDLSKARGEQVVRDGIARGLDAVIVNPTGVIGPLDFGPSRMGRFFLSLCERRLPATVRGGFNWVDVRDVAAGAIAAAERGRSGERYLLAGHWASVQTLALLAEQAYGAAPPRFEAPMGLAHWVAPFASWWAATRNAEALFTPFSLHALENHRRVSWAKAAHELGYRARPLRKAVASVVDWFLQTGTLEPPIGHSAPAAAVAAETC